MHIAERRTAATMGNNGTRLLAAVSATGLALAASLTVCALAEAQEQGRLSHLTPHLAAERLSHLSAHAAGLPPPALLVLLGNGVDGVLKGVSLADEARLIDELIGAELSQQILRVGVAQAGGRRVALVKLQAGSKATGAFSLQELQADAVKCLDAAFRGHIDLAHLDLWAVVPGAGLIGEEQENLPVFSVSADRERYERAVGQGDLDDPAARLAQLDAVRYSPVFLRYAGERHRCPPSAFCDAALGEQWDTLLAQARGPVAWAARKAQREVKVLFHGRRDVDQVALTIDDGPHPLITPLMLAILAEQRVKATFFVVGKKAEQYPGLVRMIARGGHELGNHAYSNRRLHELSAAEAWAEVDACGKVIVGLTGKRMRHFRPPGGGCSPDGLRSVGALGYTTVLWTRNTGDWRKPPPQEICHEALKDLAAGDIILMHQGDMCSVQALPEIIAGIRELGLEPTTVGELARRGATVRDTPEALTGLVNGRWLGRE